MVTVALPSPKHTESEGKPLESALKIRFRVSFKDESISDETWFLHYNHLKHLREKNCKIWEFEVAKAKSQLPHSLS